MTGQEVVRRLYDARAQGDLQTVRALLHPDVVWREPGQASYSGETRGADTVIARVHQGTLAATDSTFRLELTGAQASGALVVAFVNWSATRGGRSMSGREVAVYTVRDEQIVEACFHLEDVAATDEFFA